MWLCSDVSELSPSDLRRQAKFYLLKASQASQTASPVVVICSKIRFWRVRAGGGSTFHTQTNIAVILFQNKAMCENGCFLSFYSSSFVNAFSKKQNFNPVQLENSDSAQTASPQLHSASSLGAPIFTPLWGNRHLQGQTPLDDNGQLHSSAPWQAKGHCSVIVCIHSRLSLLCPF